MNSAPPEREEEIMARRIALCLAVLVMMMAPAAWAADAPSADCGEKAFLASLTAPQVSADGAAVEALDPLKDATAASTSCCTQQEINDCYASVEPGSGCYVEGISCAYFFCYCKVFCY